METKQSSTFNWVLAGVLGLLFVLSLGWYLVQNYRAGDSAPWQLITSGLILAIPLALFYFCIGVLVVAARQKAQGQIAPRLAKVIYWSPRLAGVLIISFVSLFALDMFEGDSTLGEKLLGFLMHMLPSIAMIIVLVLAWRWEWVGFVTFLAASLFFLRFVIADPLQGLGHFLLFSGPLLLIALLFGANWRWRDLLHPAPKPAVE